MREEPFARLGVAREKPGKGENGVRVRSRTVERFKNDLMVEVIKTQS